MGLREFDHEGCQRLGNHVVAANFEEVTDPPFRKIDVWGLQMLQHVLSMSGPPRVQVDEDLVLHQLSCRHESTRFWSLRTISVGLQ